MFHPQGPTFLELLRQALSSVEEGYDLLAPRFDHTPFRTPDAILQVVDKHLEPLGTVDAGLDLCCGTGAALPLLRRRCRTRVVGVDLSQGMMAVAQARVAQEVGVPVSFHQADATRLSYREEFELAVSFGAFGHILERDEPALVASVWRALRPGGRFVFVTGDRPRWWSPGALQARAFNAAMRVRNAVWRPPFVMYYLTFLLPRATALLRAQGFEVTVERWLFPAPFERHALVMATRPTIPHEVP